MQPSKYQEAVINVWRNEPKTNLLISACPGSGKTTLLLKLIEEVEGKYLFLAFNKSIKEEISERLTNMNIYTSNAKTLHSFGRSVLVDRYNFGLYFDDKRYLTLLINSCKKRFLKTSFNNYKPTVKALNGKQAYQIAYYAKAMFDFGRMYMCIDDIKKIELILLENGYFEPDVDAHLYEDVYKSLIKWYKSELEKDEITIDYTDMIFIPAYLGLVPSMYGYDYLLVDEAQDLSVMQHTFVDLIIPKVKKWVAVGDEYQSIYGFAGSATNAFGLFKQKANVKQMPLSLTYRCPPEVVNLMDKVRPNHTEAFKQSDPSTKAVLFLTEDQYDSIPNGAMIVCRNSGPLISLYFELLSRDRKVTIKGKDIQSSLQRFCKKYKNDTIDTALSKMEREYEKLYNNREQSDKDFIKWYIFDENYSNFRLVNFHMRGSRNTIEDFVYQIQSIFKTKSQAIELMTIHKSKGLEADFVGFLDENLIPSKFATQTDQIEQELNLRFVALSRAKKTLAFIYSKKE